MFFSSPAAQETSSHPVFKKALRQKPKLIASKFFNIICLPDRFIISLCVESKRLIRFINVRPIILSFKKSPGEKPKLMDSKLFIYPFAAKRVYLFLFVWHAEVAAVH